MRPTRKIVPALLVVACVPAGVGISNVLGAGEPAPPWDGIPPTGDLAGVPGTDTLEATVADPKVKGRDWAVTVFRSKGGQTCVARGRKQGDQVGEVGPDGRFGAYPIEDGATCVDLNVVPAGVQITESKVGDRRVTVHGVAGPKVTSISLTVNGVTEDLPLGPRKAFLAVLGPEVNPKSLKVVAKLKDGSETVLLDPAA